jgi:hypothetical protein
MQGEGFLEDDSSLIEDPSSCDGLNGGRHEQTKVPVVVMDVIPVNESATAIESVVVSLKAIREVGVALDRLELALRVGIVIAHVRPAVGPGDPGGCHELTDRAARHCRIAASMDRVLVGTDVLLDRCLTKEPLSELLTFAKSKHPADHIAAVDVDDDL